MGNISVKGHLAMFGANIMWGLMSPVAKIVLVGGAITPLVMTNARIFGAMMLFWIASLFQRPERVSSRDLMRLFGAALLGIVFNQGCFIFGVSMTSPGDASIITTSMPLWAMILAALILKEPITGKKVMGIAAGATGALLLILGSRSGEGTTSGGTNFIAGDLLVLTAQFSYALYIVLYKNFVNKYSLLTIMKWMFTYAFLCVLPFSYPDLMAAQWQQLSWMAVAGIGFVVVCGTFLAYVLVVVGQKNLRPTVAGMYNYIQPVVACGVGIYWGLDSFNIVKGLAIVMIFSGVYLVTKSKSRKDIDSAEESGSRSL